MFNWKKHIPELEWIEDESLRSKVAGVWENACRIGGWEEKDIDSIPFTLLTAAGGVSLIEHTRVVTNIARAVGGAMREKAGASINEDHLIAGALLHDVGKMLEYRKISEGIEVSRSGKLLRHPLSGMGLAAIADLPEEIRHIIAVHSREGDGSYRSPEAIIVHHADFIAFETIKALNDPPPER